jgi:uncharacterized membrane protein YciS (DUF1049 family)
MLNLIEKVKRFTKESKWGTLCIYVLFVRTKGLIKRIKSTLTFMVKLSKLLINKNNDEICFITFDVVTGNYKVLTYFSTIHSIGLLYEVLISMTEQLKKDINQVSNINISETNILVDPGSKATN